MKLFCFALCLISIIFFDCKKGNESRTSGNANIGVNKDNRANANQSTAINNSPESESLNQVPSKSTMTNQKKEGDLKYAITVKKDKGHVLVNYELKNSGKKSYLLFNRGISPNCEIGKAFVTPAENGTIEIAQKFYREPQDIQCPLLESPIEQGVSILKPGQTASERIRVALPLKYNTPYNYCYKGGALPLIPEPAKKVRFCLGYIETDSDQTNIEGCAIKNWKGVGEQKLLCSDVVELK